MKVIAIERGYYGGKIQEPLEAGGEPFEIQKESHLGKWMEPQGWKPSGSEKPDGSTNQANGTGGKPDPAFTTKHNGGGRHIVVDADGKKVGDFVGASKEEAQKEVERLLAGGEPFVKTSDSSNATNQANGSGGTSDGGNADDQSGLPDA